jgi:membrane protease YdiL (CAAX protease family)
VSEPVSTRQVEREWGDIAFALKFYGCLLGIQIVTAVTAVGATRLAAFVVADVALAVATIAAMTLRWELVRDSLRPSFGWGSALVVAVAAVPVFLGIYFVSHGLHRAFSAFEESDLEPFRNVHTAWAYVVVALDAAVLEELAFRGVIYTILRKYIGLVEAVVVTSFAFAILHLSVLGLVTHVALGVYLCWLRERSGSVYPGMAAHFLHNALVLLNEQFMVLPLTLTHPSR